MSYFYSLPIVFNFYKKNNAPTCTIIIGTMRQTLLEIRLIDDSGARGPSPDSLVFHGGSKEKLGEFPGAPATHQQGSTGVEKVYSLVGFR